MTSREIWAALKQLRTHFEPWGERSRENDWGPDCSCGCRFFVPLDGSLASDWGACANPSSLRAGLLTWEHQGCREFDQGSTEESTD